MAEKVFGYWTTKTDEGKHLAVSVAEPRFCFEADTEEAVVEMVRKAIDAYSGRKFRPVEHKSSRLNVRTMLNYSRREEKHHVAA